MDAAQYRAKTIGFQPSLSCEPVTPGDAFNLSYSIQNLNVPPSQSSIANPVNVSSTFIVRGANISMPDRSGMGSDAVARTEALHPYLYTEMAQTLGNIPDA
jgi:hypothetical protein